MAKHIMSRFHRVFVINNMSLLHKESIYCMPRTLAYQNHSITRKFRRTVKFVRSTGYWERIFGYSNKELFLLWVFYFQMSLSFIYISEEITNFRNHTTFNTHAVSPVLFMSYGFCRRPILDVHLSRTWSNDLFIVLWGSKVIQCHCISFHICLYYCIATWTRLYIRCSPLNWPRYIRAARGQGSRVFDTFPVSRRN